MRKLLFPLILSMVILFACSQDHAEIVADNKVYIRIENATPDRFDSTLAGDANYGTIMPGVISEYKLITIPVYAAGCAFKINAQQCFAGVLICGTPPPPQFSQGYYTYKVTPRAGTPYYMIGYTKDR